MAERVNKAKTSTKKITVAVARKVLKVVDAGLGTGLGDPKLGKMCVEAAVCYAMGEVHGDHPRCVTHAIVKTKININDHDVFEIFDNGVKNNKLRAKVLRRLAIAQLGSRGVITDYQWKEALEEMCINKYYPKLRKKLADNKAKSLKKLDEWREDVLAGLSFDAWFEYNANANVEVDTNLDDLLPHRSTFARLTFIKKHCENLVQLLIKLKSPGTKYLYLTE